MRKKSPLIGQEGYTPNHLLDTLMEMLETKSDAALARVLAVPPSTISKVRHKQVAINSDLLLAAHELTEMSIRELRDLMGDTKSKYWLGGMDGAIKPRKTPALPRFREVMHRDAAQATHM
ncbi:hypothetical protein [Noviherbaspirillum saxi]|nr:hypothetical protein [Noviherbaspirillum saxi]